MVEVQFHGFSFEKWVRDTFFNKYEGNYGQKWDVPSECNHYAAVPESLRNLPVSIKTAKYGSPIGLGDALRQRQINEPFLMIVGFWKQRSASEKWFEEIGFSKFLPDEWNGLWGSVSLAQIQSLDVTIKNLLEHYSSVRQKAKQWKRDVQNSSNSSIVINPKIDSKTQRRIQCSLPFKHFWEEAERLPVSKDFPELFGVSFPNPVISSARIFSRIQAQAPDESG